MDMECSTEMSGGKLRALAYGEQGEDSLYLHERHNWGRNSRVSREADCVGALFVIEKDTGLIVKQFRSVLWKTVPPCSWVKHMGSSRVTLLLVFRLIFS